jgi:hypothetical protein
VGFYGFETVLVIVVQQSVGLEELKGKSDWVRANFADFEGPIVIPLMERRKMNRQDAFAAHFLQVRQTAKGARPEKFIVKASG